MTRILLYLNSISAVILETGIKLNTGENRSLIQIKGINGGDIFYKYYYKTEHEKFPLEAYSRIMHAKESGESQVEVFL